MIIIAIEGVLAEPGPSWSLTGAAIAQGRALYNAFGHENRLVLLSSDPYPDRYRSWLLKEHFGHFSEVHGVPIDSPVSLQEWKLQKLKELASAGPIMFYIDVDPETIARALSMGIPSMLVAYPATFIGKGPETRFVPWYDLVDTIEQQNLIKAARGLSRGGD